MDLTTIAALHVPGTPGRLRRDRPIPARPPARHAPLSPDYPAQSALHACLLHKNYTRMGLPISCAPRLPPPNPPRSSRSLRVLHKLTPLSQRDTVGLVAS